MSSSSGNGKLGDGRSESEQGAPGSAPGTSEQGEVDADFEPADPEVAGSGEAEPPPHAIAELAIVCVDYVERSLGVTLDFSEDTLPVLDHYLASTRAEADTRPEVLAIVARAVGAYFGEVLRHRFGGFWRVPSENIRDWQWCARSVFLSVNPVGVAYDAISGSDDHEGPSSRLRVLPEDRAALDARLAALPPVPEDEYYWLTTRIEAIEVAMVTLRARMSQTGYEGVEFDENDYAAEERQF